MSTYPSYSARCAIDAHAHRPFRLVHDDGRTMAFVVSTLHAAMDYAQEVWQCDALDITVVWGAR